VIVLGDLVVDVVLAPATELVTGTDVPGWVMLRQGGSATTTARLGRSGARVTLIAAVGRDAAGRSPLRAVRADGVTPHVARVAGCATGRIGVLVAPGGERSFVQDRGAALRLSPEHLREAWFTSAASSNPVSRSKLEVTLRRTPNWVSFDVSGPPIRRHSPAPRLVRQIRLRHEESRAARAGLRLLLGLLRGGSVGGGSH
jgi:hypothetical protein